MILQGSSLSKKPSFPIEISKRYVIIYVKLRVSRTIAYTNRKVVSEESPGTVGQGAG
jgi:hypothetical protein